MTLTSEQPSPQALRMLEALRDAVARSLEKKQRLGQYAVIWQNGHPVQAGNDAPSVARK